MIFKDYYKILELETSRVSIEEIKNAYRIAAKKYHPDVNLGNSLAEERIKDINEAYRILSVPASKRKYDRTWNAHYEKTHKKIKGKNSILEILIGNVEKSQEGKQKHEKKNPIRGEDIETEITIGLLEAFYGMEKKISLKNTEGKLKTYTVTVPKGIRRGEKIRLIGQGKTGQEGGKNGDLLIKINIADDRKFKLQGYDLLTDLYLSPWEAALGTRVTIATIEGETKIYIPQGIQSGEKIKIPNKGYPNGNKTRGDLIAEIKIMVPKKLELDEKEMFEKLKEMSRFNPRNE